MDISINFKGITLKNPVIVTAGEHGRDGKTIKEVAASGVGAITTKTITNYSFPDPLPCLAKIDNGFLNCVLAAVQPSGQKFDITIIGSGGVSTWRDAVIILNKPVIYLHPISRGPSVQEPAEKTASGEIGLPHLTHHDVL